MRLCEIYRLESGDVYGFPCLLVKMLNLLREKNKRTEKQAFLNGFAFVDPTLLSLEGPNYKEVLFTVSFFFFFFPICE